MVWYAIIGAASLILSFLYFFRPEAVKKLDGIGEKLILSSEKLLEKRYFLATFYLIAGLVLVSVAVYL